MGKKVRRKIFINFKRFIIISFLILITTNWAQAIELTKDTISDFITVYPGVYTEKEKDLVKKYFDEAKAMEDRGTIDIKAMINGTLPKDTPGYVRSLKITENMVRYFNQLRDPENPLLNDSAYAKKAGYKDIIAYPTIAAHDDSFLVAFPQKARDTLLVADLIHSVTNYKPVYPGDTLYWVKNARHVKDLTPETGSIYRSNAIVCTGSVYNQRGEKVLDVKYTVEENTKIYKEGKALANPGFNDMWEERSRGGASSQGAAGSNSASGARGGGVPGGAAPGGGGMPGGGTTYYYTDADWKILKVLWSKEKHQGSTPLYWEDVKIGDQPAMTLEGPVESAPSVAVPWGMGLGGNQTLKKYIMDEKTFKTFVRSETDGIYRPANKTNYVLAVPAEAKTGMSFGEVGQMDANMSAPDGGASSAGGAAGGVQGGDAPAGGGMGGGNMMNFSRRDYAIRHISDWIGDKGWLYNIRWGGLYSRDMIRAGEPSPAFNPDAEHYFEDAKVPSNLQKAILPLGQGKGDSKFLLVRSYVYNKYVKDGEFFVDIAWWIETVGGSNFGEGAATVKLPSKNTK